VARVVAFIPDLLFGSNVLGALQAAGHDAQLVSELGSDAAEADVIVLDLTADADERLEALTGLDGAQKRVLAFYSHVETDVREQAERAGVDVVVPRSRMNREGAELVRRLVADE
jgi:DNA-binding NarL/FixJ family response regulator